MARPDHLFVFAYDVARDTSRAKLATLLDESLDRVQLSVFEGRLSLAAARRLARRAEALLGPDDSLRVYAITEAGRRASMAFGRAQLPEAHDFLLF
ncbi:CRISPR-associated endonuclease Cas2 [Roseomonas sp. AR75]|uniref:CRISPR-associated endonuclease Cas2 n=1 Tax=Roseomonas sp. AR75 TaxID=2562311 RepID=UPI0010C14B91|nr:CRISPR-associated endonuclease Cas2 [Roseomonas sp. AR75]